MNASLIIHATKMTLGFERLDAVTGAMKAGGDIERRGQLVMTGCKLTTCTLTVDLVQYQSAMCACAISEHPTVVQVNVKAQTLVHILLVEDPCLGKNVRSQQMILCSRYDRQGTDDERLPCAKNAENVR